MQIGHNAVLSNTEEIIIEFFIQKSYRKDWFNDMRTLQRPTTDKLMMSLSTNNCQKYYIKLI